MMADPSRAHKKGQGSIVFVRSGERTVLHTAKATSPLRLLLPKNHGNAAWVFLASLGGGLVEGDVVGLDVRVGPSACGLVGTQASTKVYRCPTGCSEQRTVARVDSDGLLVMVPDPVACFAGARYRQSITVDLAATGSLVLLDAYTAGRTARGERWDLLRYSSRIVLRREGELVVQEAVLLDPQQGDLRARMGRFEAFATIFVMGPRTAALTAAIAAEARPLSRRPPVLVSVSPIRGPLGVTVRLAGDSAFGVAQAVRETLRPIGALLGDDPFARKW